MALSPADSQRMGQQIEREKRELTFRERGLQDLRNQITRIKQSIAGKERELRQDVERLKLELGQKESEAKKLESQILGLRGQAQTDEHELTELKRRVSDITKKAPFKRAA